MGRRRALITDAGAAVGLAVVAALGTVQISAATDPDRRIDALGLVLIVLAALVLLLRRRRPLVVLAVATVSVSTYLSLGYPYGPVLVCVLVAVYTVAALLPMRVSLPAAAAGLGVLLLHLVVRGADGPGPVGLLPGSAWIVVPYAVGTTVRQTRAAAERTRAELVRDRVADERLRVAQEVHDVVGHGLMAIKMQADIALHVLAKKPEQAEAALTAISRTSTEALTELRSALAFVRHDDGASGPSGPSGPSGLSGLDGLRRRMADAGLEVRVRTTGTPSRLPPPVDLVAYRVLQEALTNVLRHSDGTAATVDLDWQPDAVEISATSAGGTGSTTSGGLGLAGLRHRVEALGGTFSAGPGDPGQFRVRARLPLEPPVGVRR